jgi:hypothetical protein
LPGVKDWATLFLSGGSGVVGSAVAVIAGKGGRVVAEEHGGEQNGGGRPSGPQETDVRILAWPEGDLDLRHSFNAETTCPVKISFDEGTPAQLAVALPGPVAVEMNMNLATKQDIPLCLKICEPICARSTYAITLDIFDRPVALIKIQGETRLAACAADGQTSPGISVG